MGNTLVSDDAALRRQIVGLIPRLRRFALGLTGSPADADDLVQVALEKALTRLNQFKPGTRLDSWLFRIVQTSFIDDRRKVARREESMESETLARLPGAHAPDNTAERAELRDVDRALASLSEDQRVLAVLCLVEGYSYQEASDTLNVPIGTVMSRLARARKALTARLREAGYDRH